MGASLSFRSDLDDNSPQVASDFRSLTAKQLEVLALLADNRTSKEIAGYLGVTESAINQRIDTARARVGVNSRGELARRYRKYVEETAAHAPMSLDCTVRSAARLDTF